MGRLVRNIKHQSQPAQHECVHTCLSMVTGIPLDAVRRELPERGLDDCDVFPWLVRHRILPVKEHRWIGNGLYLCSMASLNYPAKLHMVVVDMREREIVIYDPQEGTGYNFIARDGWRDLNSYIQMTRLVDCGGPTVGAGEL